MPVADRRARSVSHFYDRAAQVVLRVQVTRDGQPRVQGGRHVKRAEQSETGGPGEVEPFVAEGQLLYQTPGGPYDRVRGHSSGDRIGDGEPRYAGEDGRHVRLARAPVACFADHRAREQRTAARPRHGVFRRPCPRDVIIYQYF